MEDENKKLVWIWSIFHSALFQYHPSHFLFITERKPWIYFTFIIVWDQLWYKTSDILWPWIDHPFQCAPVPLVSNDNPYSWTCKFLSWLERDWFDNLWNKAQFTYPELLKSRVAPPCESSESLGCIVVHFPFSEAQLYPYSGLWGRLQFNVSFLITWYKRSACNPCHILI